MIVQQNNQLIEEPIPQILSKNIFDPDTNSYNILMNKIDNTIDELPEDEETIINIDDESEITAQTYSNNNNNLIPNSQFSNIATTLEDIFKATIHQMKLNNKTQVDIDQCCYDFSKEISRLKINKETSFQIRMIFDICKRQLKEKELERIIERCKIKVDESIRAKRFNRLIEDANRRLEVHDQLESMKGKLDEEIVMPSIKKYKDQQWNEIYNERFLKYKNEKEKKMQKLMEEKKRLEKKKEEEIIELCKVKKAPLNVVEEYGKRLYEDQKNNKEKDKDNNNKAHHCGSKSNNKVITQEDKEIKDQHKTKYDKRISQDAPKKPCSEEDNGNGSSMPFKAKEEYTNDYIVKKEVHESYNNEIEHLKVNLKDNTKEKSRSQEKLKDKKINAFSVNKKESVPKLKKLKYNDFLPNNNDRKVYDDKQTNKILNHFFVNQVGNHS